MAQSKSVSKPDAGEEQQVLLKSETPQRSAPYFAYRNINYWNDKTILTGVFKTTLRTLVSWYVSHDYQAISLKIR